MKYSPAEREGISPSWTSISDIGDPSQPEVLTEAAYMETEGRYLNAIRTFATAQGVSALQVEGLEVEPVSSWWQRIEEGDEFTIDKAVDLSRSILRQDFIWCRLSFGSDFFVHFGYDYYMYIGMTRSPDEAVAKVRQSGLYVDDFESPYLT
ncbi:hypothetical protein ACWC5I_19445 [Kitasatospora sp. NPDC001574]